MHASLRRGWEEINALLARADLDVAIVRRSSAEALGYKLQRKPANDGLLPPGAEKYLKPTNVRLSDLSRRYERHPASGTSEWSRTYLDPSLVLPYFRADGPYIWQQTGREAFNVQLALTAVYIERNDPLGLSDRLREDGLFGVRSVDIDGRKISRDLLDSICELTFLEETLHLSKMSAPTILDIGAGYGRLAHRGSEAFPQSRWLCVDGVPLSTFLSEYYLGFRDADRAQVVALDQVEEVLPTRPIDIAVNIHSFSECSLKSISWWIDRLVEADIPYLMIVPNTGRDLLSTERLGRQDFTALLEGRGYSLEVVRDKYANSSAVQEYGIVPSTYFLFVRNVRSA